MRGNIFRHLSSLARAEHNPVMNHLKRRADNHKDERGAGIADTPVLSFCGSH
jgi:hypothetical protein